MPPEGLCEEYSLTDRIRNSLIASAPEHGDLIAGRDAIVTAYHSRQGVVC